MPVFFVIVFVCILILVLSLSGRLKFLSFLERPATAIQSLSYNLFQKLPFVSEDSKIKDLREENLELLSKIADYEKLKRENAALLDQFQTSYPRNYQLVKAEIIGAPSFVPGVSDPTHFILNKGSKDNLKVGLVVVIQNNLVGIITSVFNHLSKADIVNNSSLSFTAKTENGALGVVKSEGQSLSLENVLLSENISEQEIVLTKGDINADGIGIPPDLIVGKIISVEKSASDLFQKAKIKSFVDFSKLSTVFIYTNTK